jgi:ABC-type phosphonate transport system ATPase subunit
MTEAENLSKRYGEKLAVDGRDFVAYPGIVLGLNGESMDNAARARQRVLALFLPLTAVLYIGAED